QERALRARGAPRALGRAALRRVLMHYERVSRHALRTLPARADIRLVLDACRRVRAIDGPEEWAPDVRVEPSPRDRRA
ncbi:MAG: hypothetical protein ACTHK2_00710, partial [Dokdonella sp.]